jgi:hypothetical protein
MSTPSKKLLTATLLLVGIVLGCKSSNTNTANSTNGNKNTSATTNDNSSGPDDKGIIHSAAGEEKEKPAAGKANVQGKVVFDSKPAPNIEVKLCEKFNQFAGGCQGQIFTARSDANGEYLIKDVPPGVYEGLTARVFDTPYYVFATSGYVGSAKYQLDADKTFFAPNSNLFKSDLKLITPKAGAKVSSDNLEIKWDSYADAAYYKFSIYADEATGAKADYDDINKRIDGTSYLLDKPLAAGSYRIVVTAYNANDVKIADSPDDIKFTVTGH